MAKIATHVVTEFKLGIELNEKEARALEALAGYGVDPFLRVFYEHLGRHYLQPHEQGLRALFESITETVPSFLRRVDAARQAFNKK